MNARIAALGLLLPLAAGSAVAAEEGSSVKDAAKAAVSSAIETGKNLLGGVSEGITSGRQSAQAPMAPRWSPTTPASPRSARSKCSRPSRATSNWPSPSASRTTATPPCA